MFLTARDAECAALSFLSNGRKSDGLIMKLSVPSFSVRRTPFFLIKESNAEVDLLTYSIIASMVCSRALERLSRCVTKLLISRWNEGTCGFADLALTLFLVAGFRTALFVVAREEALRFGGRFRSADLGFFEAAFFGIFISSLFSRSQRCNHQRAGKYCLVNAKQHLKD